MKAKTLILIGIMLVGILVTTTVYALGNNDSNETNDIPTITQCLNENCLNNCGCRNNQSSSTSEFACLNEDCQSGGCRNNVQAERRNSCNRNRE